MFEKNIGFQNTDKIFFVKLTADRSLHKGEFCQTNALSFVLLTLLALSLPIMGMTSIVDEPWSLSIIYSTAWVPLGLGTTRESSVVFPRYVMCLRSITNVITL